MDNEYLKMRVKNLADVFAKENGKQPQFEDLVKDCIYLKGINTADYLFDSLKKGWLLNGFEEVNSKELHTKLFQCDKLYHYDELLEELKEREVSIGGPTTQEELKKANNEIIESISNNIKKN